MTMESQGAAVPGSETAPPQGAFEAGLVMAGLAFVAMVGSILVYGMWGERITQGLDQACAEAAFEAGQQLAAIGNDDGAEQRFRQALEGRFADDTQRYMCARSIGELLSRRQRYAEAVEVYEAMPPEALTESGHYTAYVLSLWHSGRLREAEKLGALWLRLAESEQNRDQLLWAHNALMHIAAALGQPEDVLRHGQAVLKLDTTSVAALLVAKTLLEQGDPKAALARVNAFIEATDNPGHLEEAKLLRARILETRPTPEIHGTE